MNTLNIYQAAMNGISEAVLILFSYKRTGKSQSVQLHTYRETLSSSSLINLLIN